MTSLTPAFILTTLVLGLVCSLPGVIVGRILAAKGVVQDYKVKPVVLTVFVVLAGRLLLPGTPMIGVFAFGVLFSTFGVYRSDWWTTHRKGRWWWFDPSEKEKPFEIILGVVVLTSCIFAVIWAITKH